MTQKKRKSTVQLSLKLATAQGATFLSYYGVKGDFKGIPFEIVNEKGDVVHESLFKFG